MLDSIEPAIDIVEPLLNGGIIQLDASDLALKRAEPRHNFVELAINAVETIVEPRETSAQEVESVAGCTHASSSTTSVPLVSTRNGRFQGSPEGGTLLAKACRGQI